MKDWSELSDQNACDDRRGTRARRDFGLGPLLQRAPPPSPSEPAQTITQSAATAVAPTAAPQISAAKPSGDAAQSVATVSASAEQSITIESDLYRVVLSNRGAVARSWQLKKYTDEHEPPRTLDLIQSDASQAAGGWPFSLEMGDPQLQSAANQGLYVVTQSGATLPGAILNAPAEVEFRWSDGQLEVTKRWKFDRSYITQLETSVRHNGLPVAHRVAWRGGFGDATAFRAAIQTLAFSGSNGNMTPLTTKKLGASGQPNVPADQPGMFDAVGIEDLYFAAAFLPPDAPPGPPAPNNLTFSAWQLTRNVQQPDGKTQQDLLPEVAPGRLAGTDRKRSVFSWDRRISTR